MTILGYLIGAPGAGKTTTFHKALPPPLGDGEAQPGVIFYGLTGIAACTIGPHRRGTDALPMNVITTAVEALRPLREADMTIYGEGDRLANMRFFQTALTHGFDLRVAWLDTRESVAAARRVDRGTNQNASWVRGRRTKVLRLAANLQLAGVTVMRMDGEDSVARNAKALAAFWEVDSVDASTYESALEAT
jgi:hypothetical protein